MTVKSLRDFAWDSLEAFLYREGFAHSEALVRGVAYLANHICQYQEESIRLRPELLIATDLLAVAKTLPTHIWLPIGNGPLEIDTFKRALKACAPLARENWIIGFNITNESVGYGVLASGMAEPNPSPYFHLKVGFSELVPTVIYLKAISTTLLLVKGKHQEFKISFSLEEYTEDEVDHFGILADQITRSIREEWKDLAKDFFVALLEQAAEASHGCLIAVLSDQANAELELKKQITNGIFLPEPIDIARLLIEVQETHDYTIQMALASVTGVIKRMISHDGITLFSCDGRLLGYNLFVPSNDADTSGIVGGARSRAFTSLCTMPSLNCAIFRSQDGLTKIHVSPGTTE